MNEHDILYYKSEKKRLIAALARFPSGMVLKVLHELTGRYDLSSANIFCLALMENVLRTKFGNAEIFD